MVRREGNRRIVVVEDDPEVRVTQRKGSDAAQAEHARLLALIADIGTTVTDGRTLPGLLQQWTDILVSHLDTALVQIWRPDQQGLDLRLEASAAGRDEMGGAAVSPAVVQAAIERVARDRRPYVTNAVGDDPILADRTRARPEGPVAFAGHPLLVADRLVGVVAMFARHPLNEAQLQALAPVAVTMAQGIDRVVAEAALRESEERFRSAFEDTTIGMTLQDLAGGYLRVNRAFCQMVGDEEAELLGARFEEITHSEDRGRDVDSDREMLAGRRHSYQVEKRYILLLIPRPSRPARRAGRARITRRAS